MPYNDGHIRSGGFSKRFPINRGRNYNRSTALGNPQNTPLLICRVSSSLFFYQCTHCPHVFELHLLSSFVNITVHPVPQSPRHKFLIIITAFFLSFVKSGLEKQYQFLSFDILKPSLELFQIKFLNFSFCNNKSRTV